MTMDPSKRNTYVIAAISLVVISIVIYFLFIFQKSPKEIKTAKTNDEVTQIAELDVAQRPYVTLTPTSDGAEIVISIENMGSFDRMEYELTYLADNPQVAGQKIERGATGTDVNTKDEKYKKSVLLGTASKGVRSPDTGIESGKLTLHMFKGEKEYLSESEWNVAKIGLAPIKDSKGNFKLEVPALGKEYWAILADTVGIPKNDQIKSDDVVLPVWGVFSIAPQFAKPTNLSITLGKESKSPKLYSYNHQDQALDQLEASYDPKTQIISAQVKNLATFIVVSSK